jgi:hypothetical protein
VGGWIKNEGSDYLGFKNMHRGQNTTENEKYLTQEWEDYGFECYENEINGTKFEPFTYREK